MKLDGRTILVTGGSAGIGLAFAQKFLSLGNTVIITGRKQDKLDAAKAAHPELHTIQCDASDPDALRAMASKIDAEFPKLDVLMNNAGIFIYRNLTTGTDDLLELTKEIDINISGAIRTVSVLIDRLVANKGTLINVSSGLAYVPLQAAPIYCATKAAIHSYTTSLRQQLEGKVEVIELMPPATKTDLTVDLPEDGAFTLMTTDELVKASFAKLKAGALEIRPGQANQLHWMSRIAPGFINGQLAKGSAELVPQA
jgi:uncharacterized oxidoreductase